MGAILLVTKRFKTFLVRLLPALAALFALFSAVSAGAGAGDVQELIEKVGLNYYNPVIYGLSSLTADVEIPGIKESLRLRPGFEELDFRIQYRWSANGGESFAVVDLPSEFGYLESNILRMLVRDGVVIIPRPVTELIVGYKLQMMREVDGFTIVANATSPANEVRSYILRIDNAWRVVELKSFSETEKRASMYKYTQRDAYSLVSEEKALVQKPTKQYYLVREVEYNKMGSFWIVTQLTLRYTDDKGSNLAPPKVMRFSNFFINGKPVAASTLSPEQ